MADIPMSSPEYAIGHTLGVAFVSDNLFFDGERAYWSNGLSRPKLYAPVVFEDGRSISHLDPQAYPYGTENSLMVPDRYFAESVHTPGPVLLAMLEDIGWTNAGRIVTVSAPEPELVVRRNNSLGINWIDNKAGALDIEVLQKTILGDFIPTACSKTVTSTLGSNSFSLKKSVL